MPVGARDADVPRSTRRPSASPSPCSSSSTRRESIFTAFLVTAGMFGALAVFGARHQDRPDEARRDRVHGPDRADPGDDREHLPGPTRPSTGSPPTPASLIFAALTAYDMQKITQISKAGPRGRGREPRGDHRRPLPLPRLHQPLHLPAADLRPLALAARAPARAFRPHTSFSCKWAFMGGVGLAGGGVRCAKMPAVQDETTRRGNYESGADYVLEYGELRFSFNERDFAQRVEQAAVKLDFVRAGPRRARARGPAGARRQRRDPRALLPPRRARERELGGARRPLQQEPRPLDAPPRLPRRLARPAGQGGRAGHRLRRVDSQTFGYVQPDRDSELIELSRRALVGRSIAYGGRDRLI